MRILVTFLLVFVSAMSFGQSFDWLNSIGDEGFENVTALGVGPDSTYVISGTIRSDELDFDPSNSSLIVENEADIYFEMKTGYIAKYAADGSVIWAKKFPTGMSTESRGLNQIIIASDNSIIGVGWNQHGSTFSTSSSGCFAYGGLEGVASIVRYDSNGNCQWLREVHGTSSGSPRVMDVYTDDSNNVYFSADGFAVASGGGISNIYLNQYGWVQSIQGSAFGKYSPNGTLLWLHEMPILSMSFDGDSILSVSGSFADSINLGDSVNSPWHYTSGYSDTIWSGGSSYSVRGDGDPFIGLFNIHGGYVNSFSFGSTAQEHVSQIETDGEGIYVAGFFNPFGQSDQFADLSSGSGASIVSVPDRRFLARFDYQGNLIWGRALANNTGFTTFELSDDNLSLVSRLDSIHKSRFKCHSINDSNQISNDHVMIISKSGELLEKRMHLNYLNKSKYKFTPEGDVLMALNYSDSLVLNGEFAGFVSEGNRDIAMGKWSVCDVPNDSLIEDSLSICLGDSAMLEALGGEDYNWCGEVENGQSFLPEASQTYSVLVRDSLGCYANLEAYIEVSGTLIEDTIYANVGDSVFVSQAWQTQSGVYTDTIASFGNCDTILITNLIFDSIYITGPDTCWDAGQKVVNSDRAVGDFFGSTVAIDGDWAAIGTSDALPNNGGSNGGAIYMFNKSGSSWSESQKLVPNYRSAGERMSNLLAIDGDHLLAANAPTSSSDTIKLYYFKRNTSNVWQQEQVITAGFTNKRATSLTMEGSYAYAGISNQGKVLVFKLTGSVWSLDTTIQGASGNRFGISVDVEDDLLAVGAFWDDYDENGQNNIDKAGSVKLYRRNGSGSFVLDDKVVSPGREVGGYFGWDVVLIDGELFVGSYTHDTVINSQTLSQSGIVYRFADSGGWGFIQSIAPDELFNNGLFGYNLDGEDGKLLVGHRKYSGTVGSTTYTSEGAAHLFEMDTTNMFVQTETFYSTNRHAGDEFSVDVAFSETSTVIGSFFDFTDENNQNSISQSGAAHFFNAECDPILVNVDSTADTICQGDSIYLEDDWQTTAGVYTDTASIDSIQVTTLIVTNGFLSYDTVSLCNGDSVLVHGNYVSTPGTYYDTTANGPCDSISVITVLEGTGSYQFVLDWIYQGDSILLEGDYQTVSDIYLDTLSSSLGCDSIVETFLWVYPVQNILDTAWICQGDSIWLGGALQTTAGSYYDTIWSGGTAYLTTTQLYANAPITLQTSQTIYTGDSAFLGGMWRYTSGMYCDTIGYCDTIECTVLTVDSNTYFALYDTVTICLGDSHLIGGMYQTTLGVYIDTLSIGGNLDTVMFTYLTIDLANSAPIIYSSSVWLKTNSINGPFKWYDCDLESVIATTGAGYHMPGYAGNFAVIYNNTVCGDTSGCVYHNNQNKRGGLDVRGYPSNVRDAYTIEFSSPQENVHLELYDLKGQILKSWDVENMDTYTLQLSFFAAGCYIVNLHTTEAAATLKFVKVID